MGLYNMIFGKNSNSEMLLKLLGFSEGDFYRFRDCYLEEYNGKRTIAIYTRAGGGNSQCWCDEWDLEEGQEKVPDGIGQEHHPDCVILVNERMVQHPLFITRRDDAFDRTYCTYYFRIPDAAELDEMESQESANTLWKEFLDSLV